ncbi:hypothetical protein L861_06570 [Litchfieldella anticariensis FP35 = DSM 16096]|uniref:Uncharacterized protein n=1 Tax=Litchfieldella anticariensis (strain DSM 16096 / CECT 5854 / CIP 108499 / LMG 22089 / FP35) TaxID=1121939 RepID=S2KJM4_LITA3|nr:hypothetical protein [Halomonas anticariensis]EPC00598.1 hypothetical protein L861_06570 [Halomonas anticariensis FP35 = DSM 16096]
MTTADTSREHWLPIRLIPDPATREVLNAGVGVVDQTGILHVRLVPHLRGLLPLYGDRPGFDLGALYDLLERAQQHYHGVPYVAVAERVLHPQLQLGQPVSTAGDSIESILETQLEQAVPLACTDLPAPLFEVPTSAVLTMSQACRRWLDDAQVTLVTCLGTPITAAVWLYRLGLPYWSLDLEGARGHLAITIAVTGRTRLPVPLDQAPQVEVVDSVDAYYLIRAITASPYVDVDFLELGGALRMES